MNRAELKQNARYSLISKFSETLKFLLLYFAVSLVISFSVSLLTLNGEIATLIAYAVGIAINGFLYMGYNSFFLKVARDEEVTYKELFRKAKMFWPCIGISLLIGLFTLLGTFLFIIPGIIVTINYSFVYFVKLDNPELKVMEVLNKSKELMNGHKLDFFILIISFLPWYIIGFFTFGLLYLWLIPYMQITFVNFYDEIKE